MKRYRSSEYIFVSIIIACAVFLSMSQTILYRLGVPKGSVYPYVHNFVEDYYYYLHIMRQGWEGNWLATSRYTAEQFSPQFVVFWLLFLGHVARIFHLSLPVIYTLARAFGASLLFVLVYIFLHLLWPTSRMKRVTGLLFVLFGTYWWGWSAEGPTVAPLVRAWTALDPLFRGSYIPHHLWSKVFMMGSFMYIATTRREHSFARVIVPLLLVVIMSLASPVSLLPFILILFPWGIVEFVKGKKHARSVFGMYWVFALVLSLGLIVFYVNIEQSVFPWTTYKVWEETMRFPVTVGSYLQAIGPTGILFFFGAWSLFRQNALGRLLVLWALAPFVELFILGPFLPLSTIRFLDNYEFIPLGIGAVEGFRVVVSRFANPNTTPYRTLYRLSFGIVCLYFTMGIMASWNQQSRYIGIHAAHEQVYVPKDYIDAFQFLETQKVYPSYSGLSRQAGSERIRGVYTRADSNASGTKASVVLAPYTVGTMLPAFTGMRVVAGHTLMTYESLKKQGELKQIYEQGDGNVLRQVILRDGVSYMWLPKDNRLAETMINEGFVQIYSNARVTLFSTQK